MFLGKNKIDYISPKS